MKILLITISMIAVITSAGFAQTDGGTKQSTSTKPLAGSANSAAMELARSAFTAHGGEKLKAMKSLVLKGSVDLNFNNQSMPAAFSTAISGSKYFFEINSPFQQLKQVYDGQNTFSSIQGFSLPPVTSLGFPLLPRVGDPSYAVSESKKGKKGFRITTPEGFYTDFQINEKTGQIKSYESAFESGGRVVTTSVDIEGYQIVEGIVVPTKYSQRFDLGPVTAYANFKTKTVLINSTIEDSAFALPK